MNNKPLLTLLTLGLLASACTNQKKSDPAPAGGGIGTVQLVSNLSGNQTVPATASTATGELAGSYDKASHLLSYVVQYRSMAPTEGSLRLGAPGQNGSRVVLFSPLTTPIVGNVKLTNQEAEQLLLGNMYAELKSATFPGGEIRGNISIH